MEREDRAFVAKKLGLSDAEFDEIMNAERKTFWDYPSSERDLPGTKTYQNYIWQARFFGGDFFKSDIDKVGYYVKYYVDRYIYFAKWWINRVFYFAWAYAKRYAYFAWHYTKQAFYYAWHYTRRLLGICWRIARRIVLSLLNLARRAARLGIRVLKACARYGWLAITRPDRIAVRIAGFFGTTR